MEYEFDFLTLLKLLHAENYTMDICKADRPGVINVTVSDGDYHSRLCIDLDKYNHLGNPNSNLYIQVISMYLRMRRHGGPRYIKCECGGTMYDPTGGKSNCFRCDRCGKRVLTYKLDYDEIYVNDKTGWIFPVKTGLKFEEGPLNDSCG